MLEVRNLTAAYGRARVLSGVSLEVERGEVAVLFGRNGAGKSTTLKAIMGLVPATGEVRFEGRPILGLPAFRIARLGLGYVPEDRRLFLQLTVAENLEVGRRAASEGRAEWTAERVYGLFPQLAGMKDRRAGRMSGGEQQMLAVARALMGNPRALLLDEPSEGLAPLVVAEMANTVLALKREGLAVVLSEQNPRFARRVGDRAYLIERGRVLRQAPLEALEPA